jgi:glycosyltransferase involved in cell wall biosynthesis
MTNTYLADPFTKMNIIYISYDGMTDPLGQSQVIPYLIGLTQKGYSFTLVSCEKKDKFIKHKADIEQLLSQHNISWHPVPYSMLPSVFSKQKNLLLLQRKVNRLCKTSVPDVVHCRSYMAALIGLELKKRYGVKFIFDMRGFWADERLDGGIWKLKNPLHKRIYNYFKRKETEFLQQADYTISLTQNAKEELLSWPKIKGKNIPVEVIPCCVDLNVFSPDNTNTFEQQKLREQLHISPSDFVISYLGSIGTWYLLDEMLDFFKVLLLQKPSAKFLFITPDNKQDIITKAENKGIPTDKIIIHSVKRNEVALFLSLSQIAVYFIKPAYSKKASSPTKTGEIMAMGIPIITNTGIGDSDHLLTSSGYGMLVKRFSTDEYERVIKEIDVLLNSDKSKIRTYSQQNFSLEKGVELYNTVYKKIKNKP